MMGGWRKVRLIVIWVASVLALGIVAGVFRVLMMFAGLRICARIRDRRSSAATAVSISWPAGGSRPLIVRDKAFAQFWNNSGNNRRESFVPQAYSIQAAHLTLSRGRP